MQYYCRKSGCLSTNWKWTEVGCIHSNPSSWQSPAAWCKKRKLTEIGFQSCLAPVEYKSNNTSNETRTPEHNMRATFTVSSSEFQRTSEMRHWIKKSTINFRTASDAYLHCAAPRVPTVPQQPPAGQFVTIVCEIHFILSPDINGKHSLGSHRVHYVSCWTPTKVTVSTFCFTYRYCSLHFTWRKGCKVVLIHLCTEVRGCIHVQLCSLIYLTIQEETFIVLSNNICPSMKEFLKLTG